jgi:2-polyprenyl-6-methoxyphenol hydroxylase-like FAD-dependent oxidoreductase
VVEARRGGVTGPVDVLVVGAGPTGLALALQARLCGATVRVLERRTEAWRPSRALLVHPRTLEVLRPLGVVGTILSKADVGPDVVVHVGRRRLVVRTAARALSDTPYPHLTIVRQADIEAALSSALAEHGVAVERGAAVTGFSANPAGDIEVDLRSTTGTRHAQCRYLVGCDGATSTVRAKAGLRWRGFEYPTEIVLADVELGETHQPDGLQVALGRSGMAFLFPGGEHAAWRLLATRPIARPSRLDIPAGQLGPPVATEELTAILTAAGLAPAVERVAWSSRVRVAHRLADSFRSGRVFLAGDAAHLHSPATGQGMNTGIQDATNLGWKLAYAARGSAGDVLLDSYERERRPVARAVSTWTDLAFWVEAGNNPLVALARGLLAPLAAPFVSLAVRPGRVLAEVIRTLGQLRVGYRDSPLSVRCATPAGPPRAGDRLPDADVTVGGQPVRLHDLTARPGLHVLLRADRTWPYPDRPQIRVHRVDDWTGAATTIVRPDGYVGLASDAIDDDEITRWLALVGLPPSRHDGA